MTNRFRTTSIVVTILLTLTTSFALNLSPVAASHGSRGVTTGQQHVTGSFPRVRYARSGHGESISRPIQVKLPRATHLAMAPGSVRGHAEVLSARGLAAQARARVGKSIQPTSPALTVKAPTPVLQSAIRHAIRSHAVQTGTSFNASSYTGWIPPDGGMAVGPHQVVVGINGAINTFTKGGTLLTSATLATFFDGLPLASDSAFDPHVIYDPYLGRFWIVATVNDAASQSNIYFALSNDSDTQDGWSTWWQPIGSDFPGDWCDYPEIGVSVTSVYVTCNNFSFTAGEPDSSGPNASGHATSMIRVMPKTEFTGAGCCSWWEWWDIAGSPWSIQPAVMNSAGTSDGEYLASASGTGGSGNNIQVFHITNEAACCGSAPTFGEQDRGVGSYDSPPCVSQPGSTFQCLDNGDSRLLGAVWRYPYLYTWSDIACNSGYACPFFAQINTTNNSLTQQWHLNFGSGYYSMYPHVGVRPDGSMAMVSDDVSASNTLYASSWVTGVPPSSSCTVCNTGTSYVAAGSGNYERLFKGRNRWGDYSGAYQDPDGTGIWVMGEYATSSNTWGMQEELTYEAGDSTAPTTSASLSPGRNAAGWSNQNTSVNISASDNATGVYYITYSASGAQTFGPFKSHSSSVAPLISTEGQTTVSYSATDNWDNTGSTNSFTVYLDKTPPSTTITGVTNGGNYAHPLNVVLHGTDSYSGVKATYYRVDGGPWTPYSHSIRVGGNLPKPHSISYYSVDNADNNESVHSISFTVAIPSNWPEFRFDPAHSGYNIYETDLNVGNVGTLEKKWTRTGISAATGPAAFNGILYEGTTSAKIVALTAQKGLVKWSFTTGGPVHSSPAVSSGLVYAGSTDKSVYAVDASTGHKRWSFLTGGIVDSSPAISSGVVYIGSTDHKMYALGGAKGLKKWSFTADDAVHSSPAVAGSRVYFGSAHGTVYALNAKTGKKVWSVSTGGAVDSSPAVVSGIVYVGSSDRKVYALNAATGKKLWAFTTKGPVVSSPAVANGHVYIGSSDRRVYALDAFTGSKEWSFTTGKAVTSALAVANGVVYAVSRDNKVYALKAAGGHKLWSAITGPGAPTVANGRVFVGSGTMFAFGLPF